MYYKLIETIASALLEDVNINEVTHGDIFEVDLKKQTIFPLGHVMLDSGTYGSGVMVFTVNVLVMDVLDQSKSEEDNRDDILNTQLAVAQRLIERLTRGDLYRNMFQVNTNPVLEPFRERFENDLWGWNINLQISVPNLDIGIC